LRGRAESKDEGRDLSWSEKGSRGSPRDRPVSRPRCRPVPAVSRLVAGKRWEVEKGRRREREGETRRGKVELTDLRLGKALRPKARPEGTRRVSNQSVEIGTGNLNSWDSRLNKAERRVHPIVSTRKPTSPRLVPYSAEGSQTKDISFPS